MNARPWVGAMAIDAAAVLMFATAGRQSHDAGTGVGQILAIAAPFLIGLVVGWALVPGSRADPLATRTGVGIWLSTVAIGLALRRLAWDRGVALSFVIVTALVLAALLLGWRLIWAISSRPRTIRS